MGLYVRGLVILAVVTLAGCASPTTTNMIGTARAPLTADQVSVYLEKPACSEAIALLTATSDASFTFSDQAKMDAALRRLREAAAAVGANGVLLRKTGEQRDDSVYVGSGVGRQTGSVGFGINIGKSFGLMDKTAEGVALWLPPECSDLTP
ncbi:hypothetical protein PSI9734_01752 [Pseudidiomarina piscicola]|uniref:Lipoprotein n=1 Tax=Pseudidiomarina piscicola TaxID=2614830 RepID=A0A6S6WQM5_9GAMM|nr:hypothetical protein [Pseudidiomarina piscicola]CAB0151363.1 hypothetical protein PSI9734_01752 [Pseudidiomarina piscicola]VZT40844.1 hypothetical protein PSI9734_01752 [Pseudomonas aeruginosa]